MSRYARRKDANHGVIAKRFEKLGCSVLDTSAAAIPGFPDLVIGMMGVNHLVEIKNPEYKYGRNGLNANQSAFNRDWRGCPMWTVSSEDEATALVMNWRAGNGR